MPLHGSLHVLTDMPKPHFIDVHFQGFIEGKYEPIEDGASVPAGTEVLSAEEIAAKKTGTTPTDPEKLSSA